MNIEEANKKADKLYPNLVYKGESLRKYSIPRMNTGIFIFDYLTGGGIPIGRYSKFWGAKSCNKSVFSLMCARNYQLLNPEGIVLIIDYEIGFEPKIANILLDMDRVILVQPEYAEQGIELHKHYLQTKNVDFVITDSLGYMTPLGMAEAEAEQNHVGDLTKVINKMFRQTQPIIVNASREGRMITTILINQRRANIGGGSFGGDISAGGNLQEHLPSLEVRFYKGQSKKKGKNAYRFKIIKNRGAIENVSGDYSVYTKNMDGFKKTDVDQFKTVLIYAKRADLIHQSSGWLIINSTEEKIKIEDIVKDKDFFEEIKRITLEHYLNEDSEFQGEEEIEEIKDDDN